MKGLINRHPPCPLAGYIMFFGLVLCPTAFLLQKAPCVFPGPWEKLAGAGGGGGRSLLQWSGCTSASHSPWALATPSTPRAPSPRCLSLPACPRRHPGKFSHDSLPGMSQALPVLYTVSHSSHASTKIKGRGAFLWLPSLATSLKGR